MRRLTAILSATLLTALPAIASAQSEAELKAQIAKLKPKDFPTQPIELTVVYPAGGGMDVSARLLSKYFEKYSGERTIVNNRTGGGGLIGHTWLATQAPKDGHVAGVIANLVFGDQMLRSQGRWTLDDLDPIVFLNSEGRSFVVAADGPFKDKSMKEIIEMAKQKPGTIRITTVPGTNSEMMVQQIEQLTGAKFLHVPFQGGMPGVTAMLGGNVDVAIGFYGEFGGQFEAGKVKHVAVSGTDRAPFAPNSPTLNEVLGVKDISYSAVRWVALPTGVPADRKAWLKAAFEAAARDPELQAEYRKQGTVTNPKMTEAQLDAYLKSEAAAERDLLMKAGKLK